MSKITQGTARYRCATLALCIAAFMVFANLHAMQPLLPMLAEDLGRTELEVSAAYTIANLVLGVSLLLLGPLSDVLGRRGLMLFTLLGVTLTTWLLFLAESYAQLLGLRALQGFFLAGVPAVAIAYMGDEYTRPALLGAVGLYIAANSVGGVAGRLLAGLAGEWWGWSAMFLVMGGVSLVCLLAVIWLLPPSRHFVPRSPRPSAMLLDLLGHLRHPLLWPAYLIGGLNFFIFLNQFTYITFVLAAEPYQLPTAWLGLLFVTYFAGTLGSMLSARALRRVSSPQGMGLGILLLMLGTLLTLIPDLKAIIAGLLLNCFGFFFAHSIASSWVSAQAHNARASASALYLVFYYLGASSGGFYLYLFWGRWSWDGVVVGSLLVLLLTLLLSLWLQWRSRRALA